MYGIPGRDQYPSAVDFPYPKTGSPNPLVKLFLVNLESSAPGGPIVRSHIPPPKELQDIEHIVSVVAWANEVDMISTWMNRIQNHAIVQTCKNIQCKNVCIFLN